MTMIEDQTLSQMQSILELWDVTYDSDDEKYIARTNSFVILDPEQIEWIGKMGLYIFSVQKFGGTLSVKFSSGGDCNGIS